MPVVYAIFRKLSILSRNWSLQVGSVRAALPIFREFDTINDLRYGSLYLESIQVLEKEFPSLYDIFLRGFFVVRDRPNAWFASVPGDMKLEQSINRFSQSPG